MSENRENETGDELFMEELGQVQGGLSPDLLPITLARNEVELGPTEPRPWPITKPLFELGPIPPTPITTQALNETGPTLPPFRK